MANNATVKTVGTLITVDALAKSGGVMTGNLDLDGNELILDSDGDTSIKVDTDDTIDFKVNSSDVLAISSGFLRPTSNGGLNLGSSVRRFHGFHSVSGNFSGNITVAGNVDGRDVSADGTKLDGIEASATADQTKSDIDALNINADTVDSKHIVVLTQSAYNALSPDSNTIYFVT